MLPAVRDIVWELLEQHGCLPNFLVIWRDYVMQVGPAVTGLLGLLVDVMGQVESKQGRQNCRAG